MLQLALVTVDCKQAADKASLGVCGMHNQRRNLVDHRVYAKAGEDLLSLAQVDRILIHAHNHL
jgi:hypothetical protein